MNTSANQGVGMLCRLALMTMAIAAWPALAPAQSITRSWFTPPVVPETQTQPVLFEAAISPAPVSVVFNYNNADRPMFDDGTGGDRVAADGIWTIRFTASDS